MKKIALIFALCFISCLINTTLDAQNKSAKFDSDISTWKNYSLPLSSNAMKRANESTDKWDVYSEDSIVKARRGLGLSINTLADTIHFSLDPYKDTLEGYSDDYFVFKVDDGYLIGFDKGKLGGGLWWFSNSGDQLYLIEHQRNVSIVKVGEQIYVLTGGFAKQRSRVALVKKNPTGKWSIRQTFDLPNPPVAYKIIDDKLYMATDNHLVLFTQQRGVQILMRSPFVWGALFPSTLVVHGNDVYIGMHGGVVRVSNVINVPDYWELYWLKPY